MFNGKVLLEEDHVKYLGVNIDRRLTRNCRRIYWLVGRGFVRSLRNKLPIYNSAFQPVWLYSAELWRQHLQEHILRIQCFQNEYLRSVVGTGCCHRNSEIHEFLGVKKVDDAITERNKIYVNRSNEH